MPGYPFVNPTPAIALVVRLEVAFQNVVQVFVRPVLPVPANRPKEGLWRSISEAYAEAGL